MNSDSTYREPEPNNDISSAQVVSPGIAVSGSVAIASDQDWYSIEVPSAGNLKISVVGEEWADGIESGPSSSWVVTLLDSSGNTLGKFDCKGPACKDDSSFYRVGIKNKGITTSLWNRLHLIGRRHPTARTH